MQRFLLPYINNNLHLARKYARIFVPGYYLFREANMQFSEREARGKLWALRNRCCARTNILAFFRPKWKLLCVLSCKSFLQRTQFWKLGKILGYSLVLAGDIRSRDVLRPIARERKYLMDYNLLNIPWVIRSLTYLNQAPVVRRLDNAIHRINCYPVDKC